MTFTKFKFTPAFLVAQTVKRLPTMRETQVRSLGREHLPGEGNGNPLQYSCLENPMDGGAWWATVHGVAKSRTRLSAFPLRRDMTKLISLFNLSGYNEKNAICKQGKGLSPGTKSTRALILEFPASRTLRNIYPLFKCSSLQYFIVAASAH